jgi:hypothetical protein
MEDPTNTFDLLLEQRDTARLLDELLGQAIAADKRIFAACHLALSLSTPPTEGSSNLAAFGMYLAPGRREWGACLFQVLVGTSCHLQDCQCQLGQAQAIWMTDAHYKVRRHRPTNRLLIWPLGSVMLCMQLQPSRQSRLTLLMA